MTARSTRWTSAMSLEQDQISYTMRVQKFLARAGVASRRGSENLMTAGRVTVNGEVVTELGRSFSRAPASRAAEAPRTS